jgi:FHA domain
MAEELDDTRPAPVRPRASESSPPSEPADEVLVDTVMSFRRPVADLVEPQREQVSRQVMDAALGLPSPRAPRPTGHYSFRVGEFAEPVMLDRPARVGRDPRLSRISTGAPPRLVSVSSPDHEVSGTHVELRQVGSSVIVTDLRSTNGSVVMQPGSTPRKLRQGESVVVSPGALVDIGDGNILQILPMQRLG